MVPLGELGHDVDNNSSTECNHPIKQTMKFQSV